MENREFSRILSETADLMEIAAEDGFRIRSYRNAASAIESYPERVADILANPDRSVTEIQGVGKGLATVLREIENTGTCERRDARLQKFPPASLEFLKIQGLGPKSIALLSSNTFASKTIDELEQLCLNQKLRDLPRMGAKLEEKPFSEASGVNTGCVLAASCSAPPTVWRASSPKHSSKSPAWKQ